MSEPSVDQRAEPEPLLKRLMENPWALLALGVVVPFLSYTAWGWIELLCMPDARLP